jgi:regulatory protein
MAGGRRSGVSRQPRETGDRPTVGSAAADREADPESVARNIGLRLLTAAPRSRRQLADAFERRGVPSDVAERVLDRFVEVGLLDDAEYARLVVHSQHVDRGLSGRALRFALRKRGIDGELAEAAVSELSADDVEGTARALVARKLRAMVGLNRETRVRRVWGLLARKGYSPSLIARLVREMVDDKTLSDPTDAGSMDV